MQFYFETDFKDQSRRFGTQLALSFVAMYEFSFLVYCYTHSSAQTMVKLMTTSQEMRSFG